ncbi:uncharacterized protein [Drosophila kikkawai]|uniref:Uncharacterized protein n=1 Tax=Drosophila kikkawai TaxID=30033 RepID=A0ABM3C674_DROKI|nr:uncharacterized protein LOC108075769 [Drosophila kikkawai]
MLSSVCCMRLNTYGMVIGWLGVIFSILAVTLLSLGLAQANRAHISNLSVYLAVAVIHLLSSAMLVLGTVKKRHLLLLPWLTSSGVLLALNSIAQFFHWVYLDTSPSLLALPALLFSVAGFVLQWYLYNGIYSLYKQIQAKRYSASADFARQTEAPLEQTFQQPVIDEMLIK